MRSTATTRTWRLIRPPGTRILWRWKYHDDFSAGVIANARCGGDNAHRGVVVGALLAAANDIPERWLRDLKSMERLRCDTLEPTF